MSSATKKSNNLILLESGENLCEEYLATLSPKEMKGYEIAKSHLGSSFTLEKSNGFIEWKKKISK